MKTQYENVKVDAGIFGEIEVLVEFVYVPEEKQTLTTPYIKPDIEIVNVFASDLDVTEQGYEEIKQALKEKLNV